MNLLSFKVTKLSLFLFAALSSQSHIVKAQQNEVSSEAESTTEKIEVLGRRISQNDLAIGLDKTTNTVAVTREELLSSPAGISGLKMLESLPGFNVTTDGALGLYEFGNSVQVRAFNLSQMGFVLDGVPMGRSDAFGGSPIFRYVDNENLGSVVASPGAGDVSAPSYSSLGPIASYSTVNPSDEMGGLVSITIGDDNLQRTFIKLETGKIGGFSAYLSRSKTDSDLWRGPGTIDREHIEAKALYEFGDTWHVKASLVANDFFDYDSPSAPASVFEENYNYGYLPSIPEGCIGPEPGVYDFNQDGSIDDNDFTPVFTGSNCTQYYEDRINIRNDKLYSLQVGGDISENLSFKGTYYYEDKDGYGVSPDTYANTLGIYNRQLSAGLDVVHPRGVQYGLSGVGGIRKGYVADFVYHLEQHTISAGFWSEDDKYTRTQQRLNKEAGSADGAILFDEVAYYRRNYTSIRNTTQLYIKDSINLMDDMLTLEIGVKSLQIDYSIDGYRDFNDYEIAGEPGYGPQYREAKYKDHFLPMVGVVYALNSDDQVFASYAQNYALPAGTDDIFDNAISFDAEQPDGEESDNYEIGYRTNQEKFNAAVALFYTNFDNRLFESNVINPSTGQPEGFYVNGGSSEAYGIELTGVFQPEILNKELYFNTNLSYKKATLKDGFGSNPAGSQLADSPEWLFTGGITYEPTSWFVANVSAKYTSSRFTDYGEAIELDSYTVVSAYLDIGGENDFGMPDNMSIRLNVDNLFNKEVLSFAFTGTNFYRPLNPRTVQASLTIDF
jgi:iron complex outermembrane receptor protein